MWDQSEVVEPATIAKIQWSFDSDWNFCNPDIIINVNQFNFYKTFSEPEISTRVEEEKTLSSASIRNVRSRTTGNLPTRSHTLRSCRVVEPSYKLTSNQGRRTNSRASLNYNTSQFSPMITCANISLQRKIHKQILIAESDSNWILFWFSFF